MCGMGQTDDTGFYNAHGAGGTIEDMRSQFGGFQMADQRTQGGFAASGGRTPDRYPPRLTRHGSDDGPVPALADHQRGTVFRVSFKRVDGRKKLLMPGAQQHRRSRFNQSLPTDLIFDFQLKCPAVNTDEIIQEPVKERMGKNQIFYTIHGDFFLVVGNSIKKSGHPQLEARPYDGHLKVNAGFTCYAGVIVLRH